MTHTEELRTVNPPAGPRSRYDYSFIAMTDDQLIAAIGRIKAAAVIGVGAAFYNRAPDEMLISRKYALVQERLNIYWVLKRLRPDLPSTAIGRAFKRDHSTILHMRRKIEHMGEPPDPAHCSCILAALYRFQACDPIR